MSEREVIRGYYERVIAADFPGAGAIGDDEPRIKAVEVRGCHGNTQNLLFFSANLDERGLLALRYECRYCNPTMYVTAELLHELLQGQPLARIGEIGDDELVAALGGTSRKVLREAHVALRLLREALEA
ncbi:MAG TPA: hypothetical protein DEP45_14310 [Armatimonadetes bacterium]|nr:hypothetical protein [Armatimonadota bacterium]